MTGSKEGLSPAWAEQRVTYSSSSGSERPQLHRRRETPLGQKGRGCQAIISLDNLPSMLCFRIHLGQMMRMQIRGEPPQIWSGVKGETSYWPKEDKDAEEVFYISNLHHLSGVLLIQGDTHSLTSPFGVYHCFTSALARQANTLYCCALPHVVPCFFFFFLFFLLSRASLGAF